MPTQKIKITSHKLLDEFVAESLDWELSTERVNQTEYQYDAEVTWYHPANVDDFDTWVQEYGLCPAFSTNFALIQEFILPVCDAQNIVDSSPLNTCLNWLKFKGYDIDFQPCNFCNGEGNLLRSLYVQIFPERASKIPPEAIYVACDCSLDYE
ncbi:MAG: hypothetical protein KAF91_32850 [Nostoc sp. TH1S01]|nr:hypothetical protein [Nostoc sp. TH1S01]